MIKDRRFLTGIGSGLILGAILLQLMNIASSGTERMSGADNADSLQNRKYTVEQLAEIAESLGYSIYEKSETWYSRQKVDELIQEAVEKERADAELAKNEADEPATGETSVSYSLAIRSGMTSEMVAEELASIKLIETTDVFLNELNRRKLTNKLQVGTFTFDHKPALTELIDRITNQ